MSKSKVAPITDRWLQLAEAAEYLGLSKRTLTRYAHARKLAYTKGPGQTSPLRFKLSTLEAFAQKGLVPERRQLA
jgi:excisionase family DNA binding protein